MHTEDGRSITAVAKEKEEARREHEQAMQQGRMTGLVEHVTDDGRLAIALNMMHADVHLQCSPSLWDHCRVYK